MVTSKMLIPARFVAVAIMAIMLAGCPKGYGITCPTVKQYSPEFLSKVSDEIDMIEQKAPNVVTMLNDYGVERDAIRACIRLQMANRKK